MVLASASLFWTSNLNEGAFGVITVALPFGALDCARRIVRARARVPAAPRHGCRSRSALLFSLVAVYQWQTHHLFSSRKLEVDNAYASFYRVNSLFFDPSLFGRFQALAILTLVGAAPARRAGRRGPLLLVLASAAVFVGLALSYSQSSLLALDVGLVLIAGVVWRGRAVLGFAALAALVLLASLAVPTTRHKIFSTLALERHVESQLDPLEGHRRVPAPPVRRLGPRQLRALGRARRPKERARIAPHNVVLQEAVELGVLGLIVLAGIVLALLRLLLRPADAARRAYVAAGPRRRARGDRGQLALLRRAVRGPDLLGRGGARRAVGAAPMRKANAIATPASG